MEKLNQWLTLLANIGVVVGIVVLVLEVRQNTVTQRSAIIQDWVRVTQANNHLMITSDDMGPIIEEAKNGYESLDDIDRQKFKYLMIQLFNQFEAVYLHHDMGVIDDEYYESRMLFLGDLFQSAGAREVWKRNASTNHMSGFVTEIERLTAKWGISLRPN